MNNYNYDDEMREEQLAKEIGRKFAELGFGTVQTEEISIRAPARGATSIFAKKFSSLLAKIV